MTSPGLMIRNLLTVLVTLLLTSSSFASSPNENNNNRLKRKSIEVTEENMLKAPRTNNNNNGISSSGLNRTPHTGPTSKYIVKGNVDLHPPSLPQREENLEVYEALMHAMTRRDTETTFLILALFPQLKLTRYFHKTSINLYINFYHLAILSFSAEDFKTFVSFGDESDLVFPLGFGSSILDFAMKSKDQAKIEYLTKALHPHINQVAELKEKVRNQGIVSLFFKSEL